MILHKVNYYWRIIATGFCFATFGLGGLLLAISIFPIINLLPISAESKKSKSQYVIHLCFRMFVFLMEFVGVIRLTIEGKDRLAMAENSIIVANHPSLIDVVILISLLSKADCIVKQALWKNPFLKHVVSAAGYISNSDPHSLLDECVDCIEQGGSMVIFPEGTRTTPKQSMKFQRGAANMALRSGKDLTPVTIVCNPTSLTKHEKWYEVPKEGLINISLDVGNPISVAPFCDQEKQASPVAARRLTEYLEEYFTRNIESYE